MRVKCPTCGRQAEYSPDNKYRPFCSERCSTLDLGAWADEKYKVPAVDDRPPSEEDSSSVNENTEKVPPKHMLN